MLWPTVPATVLYQAIRAGAATRNVRMVAGNGLLSLLLHIKVDFGSEAVTFGVGLRRGWSERLVADLRFRAPTQNEKRAGHDKN
jgi:hypothetical protein